MKMIVFFKYFLFILLSIVLVATTIFAFKFQNQNHCVLDKFDFWDKITFVTKSRNDLNGIKNGNLNYYTYTSKKLNEVEKFLKGNEIEGLTLYFSSQVTLGYFQKKLNYNLTSISKHESLQVYYGFCNEYHDFIIHDGKKVNVQLANNGNGWVLGMPLILTGF